VTGLISCTLAAVSTGQPPGEQAAHEEACRRILANPHARRWDGKLVKDVLMQLIHHGASEDKKPHRYRDGYAVRYISEMTYEDLLAKFARQGWRCAYTNAMFDFENGSMLAPSLDRINNLFGHDEGNVVIVCRAMNCTGVARSGGVCFSWAKWPHLCLVSPLVAKTREQRLSLGYWIRDMKRLCDTNLPPLTPDEETARLRNNAAGKLQARLDDAFPEPCAERDALWASWGAIARQLRAAG